MLPFGQTALVLCLLLLASLSQITNGLPQRTDDRETPTWTEQVASESYWTKADDAATTEYPPTATSGVAVESILVFSLNDSALINQNVTVELKPDEGLSPIQIDGEQNVTTNKSAEIERTVTLINNTLPEANISTPVLPFNVSGENSLSNGSMLTTGNSSFTPPETTTFYHANNTSNSVNYSYVAENETLELFTNQSVPTFEILNGTTTGAYEVLINNTLPHTNVLPENSTDMFNTSWSELAQSTGSQKNVTATESLETSISTNITKTTEEDIFVNSSTLDKFNNTFLNITLAYPENSTASEMATFDSDTYSDVINSTWSTHPQLNESWTTDWITFNSTLGKLDTINTTQFGTEGTPSVGGGVINATDTAQLLTTYPWTENAIISDNATVLTNTSTDAYMPNATTNSSLITTEQVAFNATEIFDNETESILTTINSSIIPVPSTEANFTSPMVSTPYEYTTAFVNGTTELIGITTTRASLITAELTTVDSASSQTRYPTTVSAVNSSTYLSTIEGTVYTEQTSTVPMNNLSDGTDEPSVTLKPPSLVSPGMHESMTTQMYEGTANPLTSSMATAIDVGVLTTGHGSLTTEQASTVSLADPSTSPTPTDSLRTPLASFAPTSQISIGGATTTESYKKADTAQGTSTAESSSAPAATTTTEEYAYTNQAGLDKSTPTLEPYTTIFPETSTQMMNEVPSTTFQTPVSMGTTDDEPGTETTPITDIRTGKFTEFPTQTTTDWELTTVGETTEPDFPTTTVEFLDGSTQTTSSISMLGTTSQNTPSSTEAFDDVTTHFSSTPLPSFVESESTKPTTLFDSYVTITTEDSISTTDESFVTKIPISSTTSETISDSDLLSTEDQISTVNKITDHTTTNLRPVTTDVPSTTKLIVTQPIRPTITKLPIMYTTSTKQDNDDDDDDDDDDDNDDDDKKKKDKKNDTDDETDEEDNDEERKLKRKCDTEDEEDDKQKTDRPNKSDSDDDNDEKKQKKRRKCRKRNTRRSERRRRESRKLDDCDDSDNEQSEPVHRRDKKCSENSDAEWDD